MHIANILTRNFREIKKSKAGDLKTQPESHEKYFLFLLRLVLIRTVGSKNKRTGNGTGISENMVCLYKNVNINFNYLLNNLYTVNKI